MRKSLLHAAAASAICALASFTSSSEAASVMSSTTTNDINEQSDALVRRAQQSVMTAPKRVDVTIGVMSRCPDGVYFEGVFDRVLQQVNGKISLTMAYIAQEDDSTPSGFACKHGEQECQGNIQQLCVIDALNPSKASKRYDIGYSEAQKLWWSFIQCQNFVGGLKHIGEEKVAKQCVDALGKFPKWEDDGIEECIEGKRGQKLLRSSIDVVQDDDIVNSATLVIEGKIACVRDGGAWKQCSNGHEVGDFVRQINKAYADKNGLTFSDEEDLASTRSVFSGPTLVKRQNTSANSNNNPTSTLQSPLGQQQGSQQGAPLSVFTFIIAIALFVLVVSFVLLRIFVRNRRLRRLGIYPETPLERLLGTMPREYDDNLPPPRLWEAKIADVHAYNNAQLEATRAANSQPQRGWDALMPLSAALPPSLYPVLYNQNNPTNNDSTNASRQQTQANGLPALSSSTGARLGRRMPNLFRRTTGDADQGADSDVEAAAGGADATGADGSNATPDMDEKLSASVNVTVLIAMPSPKTVFPSRKTATAVPPPSRRSTANNMSAISQLDKVDDVEEFVDADDSSSKGKAKRAQSIRSVRSIRTATSTKSQGDARREAFFRAEEEQKPVDLPPVEAPPRFSLESNDDEEDELPELVFGTASVPLYARIATPTGTVPPSRDEILKLVAAAGEAKKSKASLRKDKEGGKPEEDESSAANAGGAAGAGAGGRSRNGSTTLHNNTQDSSLQRRSSDEAYEMGNVSRTGPGAGAGSRTTANPMADYDLAPLNMSSRMML